MIKATLNEREEFELVEKSKHLFTVDGEEFPLTILTSANGSLLVRYGLKQYNINILDADHEKKLYILKVNGRKHRVKLKNRLDLLLDKMGMDQSSSTVVNQIKAPMPGLILQINCIEGDKIARGDNLMVLEAMKMENVIKSPSEGIVHEIKVKSGEHVEKNQTLIRL